MLTTLTFFFHNDLSVAAARPKTCCEFMLWQFHPLFPFLSFFSRSLFPNRHMRCTATATILLLLIGVGVCSACVDIRALSAYTMATSSTTELWIQSSVTAVRMLWTSNLPLSSLTHNNVIIPRKRICTIPNGIFDKLTSLTTL